MVTFTGPPAVAEPYCPYGCGTVFEMTPSGNVTTIYSFCPDYPYSCADGLDPYGALVQGPDGNFYGTTYSGGTEPTMPARFSKSPPAAH